jgi:acyl carrier protein
LRRNFFDPPEHSDHFGRRAPPFRGRITIAEPRSPSRRNDLSDHGELKRRLKEAMIERLKFEDMTPEDIGDDEPLFEGGLGLDSIDALEIVVMLESEFGVKIKNESSARESFRSISTLAELVMERQAKAETAS